MPIDPARKSKLFLALYRGFIPSALVVLLLIIPRLNHANSATYPFAAFLRWFLIVFLSIAYISVTALDQVPSKQTWWKGIWRQYGTFRGDTFLPYQDRSQFGCFYYFNAIGMSVVTSLMLRWGLFHLGAYTDTISTALAVLNGFLLLIPFLLSYQRLKGAIYPSDGS